MKYSGMPLAMWALFQKSFRRQLATLPGCDATSAGKIAARAKIKYRELIAKLPEFERGDPFKMNIVSCAMLCAFLLSLPRRPSVEEATRYYAGAMMTGPMKLFCRISGRRKFSPGDLKRQRATAAMRAADRNPYSWNMELFEYPDGDGYEARFSRCGICTLMREVGLFELTPAMCKLDYTMSAAGGATRFVREYTLATGGPYCDCGYHRLS